MIGEQNEEAIPESQVQTRDGKEHVRIYDPVNNALLQEILAETKALHYTLRQIHNIEV